MAESERERETESGWQCQGVTVSDSQTDRLIDLECVRESERESERDRVRERQGVFVCVRESKAG